MTRSPLPNLPRTAARFRADRRGTSAVEFAMMLPLFCIVLVGTIDLGGILFKKFRLNSAVSAGAGYVIVNADTVTSTGASTLATRIANVLVSSNTTTSTTGTVVVNNGATATVANSAVSVSGTAANADSCYCPTLSGTTLTWGTAQACGSTCSGSTVTAGKYVSITANQAYTPSFSNYGLVHNGTVTSRVVVRAK